MKEYTAEQIRNIALVGHSGSGKTSLAEAFLFAAKATKRLGKVEDGTTASDYTEEEIRRTFSISAALLQCEHKNLKFNFLDLPGFADFAGEVVSGLRVVDTALLVVDGVAGPEAGSELAFERAEGYKIPLGMVVNKMDKENASFSKTLSAAQGLFGDRLLPVQLPIGEAATFKGFVDVVRMKAYEYKDDGSLADTAIPGDMQSACEEAQGKIIEAAAEADDALLEKYFDAGELTPEEMTQGLGKAIANRVLYPVFVADATKCSGASPLMDFAANYFPSAAIVDKMNVLKREELVEIEVGEDKPALAFIFKTLIEKHVGELTMARVYSGTLKPGMEVDNPGRSAHEKLGQMFALRGKERVDVEALHTGDLGALVKLKETQTGDTLCDKSLGVTVPPIEYPLPNIEFAVKPIGKGDEEKMSGGLNGLRREDPTFQYEVSAELKQTIMRGQGEQHLDVIASKLKNSYGIEVELFEPRIPYRETITKKTETQYRYKKQTGGRGQYGDVHIRLEPLPRGSGFEFADEITGGVIPQKFIPAVEKGVVEAMHEGALSGNQVVDVRVALFFGSYHTVDSSEQAFKTAGLMAFKQAFMACDPVLLEPIYELEVQVPEDYTGDIMGDLSSRRGKVMGMEPRGKYTVIKGQAPLAELFKYSTSLRSMTGGRARHSQKFSHYDPVPREVADKIAEAYKAAREADK